jgi:hypothetical protein
MCNGSALAPNWSADVVSQSVHREGEPSTLSCSSFDETLFSVGCAVSAPSISRPANASVGLADGGEEGALTGLLLRMSTTLAPEEWVAMRLIGPSHPEFRPY